jgi:hypothetical protein
MGKDKTGMTWFNSMNLLRKSTFPNYQKVMKALGTSLNHYLRTQFLHIDSIDF